MLNNQFSSSRLTGIQFLMACWRSLTAKSTKSAKRIRLCEPLRLLCALPNQVRDKFCVWKRSSIQQRITHRRLIEHWKLCIEHFLYACASFRKWPYPIGCVFDYDREEYMERNKQGRTQSQSPNPKISQSAIQPDQSNSLAKWFSRWFRIPLRNNSGEPFSRISTRPLCETNFLSMGCFFRRPLLCT